MTPELKKVLELLPGLSAPDLSQVEQRLRALRALTTPLLSLPSGEIERPFEDMVLDAIITTMLDRAGESVPRVHLQKSPQLSAFRKKLLPLSKFFAGLERNQQRALLHLSIKLLYDNMLQMNIPITGRLVMQHIHRLPAVINRHFPGYAQHKLLPMIIRQKKGSDNVRS